MRIKLRRHENTRSNFTARFATEVFRRDKTGLHRTILLKDITDHTGTIVTNHMWLNCNKSFNGIVLNKGDIIMLNAEVGEYEKGYRGNNPKKESNISKDYELKNILKVKKIS